jgi:hypothetical protein
MTTMTIEITSDQAQAFNSQPGRKLYLSPETRVKVC